MVAVETSIDVGNILWIFYDCLWGVQIKNTRIALLSADALLIECTLLSGMPTTDYTHGIKATTGSKMLYFEPYVVALIIFLTGHFCSWNINWFLD